MRVQLRIVGGTHRGRKIVSVVNPELRPTPDMVRESLFNILAPLVPDTLFVDIFGGTGIIGLEALSRGARQVYFIERDLHLAKAIDQNLRTFGLEANARIYRTDAYRWVASWEPPAEPVIVFLSPPFPDLTSKTDDMLRMLHRLQEKVAPGSAIVLQSEKGSPLDALPEFETWDRRKYSRNLLILWHKEVVEPAPVGES